MLKMPKSRHFGPPSHHADMKPFESPNRQTCVRSMKPSHASFSDADGNPADSLHHDALVAVEADDVSLLSKAHGDANAVPEGLEQHSRLFAAVARDYRLRLRFLASDWRDGLTAKTVSAACFMFFATFASTIALAETARRETANRIGVSEYLIMNCVAGIVNAVVGTQPLLILRPTGPITAVLIQLHLLSKSQGVDFWQVRFDCFFSSYCACSYRYLASPAASVMDWRVCIAVHGRCQCNRPVLPHPLLDPLHARSVRMLRMHNLHYRRCARRVQPLSVGSSSRIKRHGSCGSLRVRLVLAAAVPGHRVCCYDTGSCACYSVVQ